MKTLRILSLLLIVGLVFSCEKDVKEEVKMGEVSFGIDYIDPVGTKDSGNEQGPEWPICPDDMVPVTAHIEILLNTGVTKSFTPQVFYLNGELYTQAIKLPTGTHSLEKFLLLNADEDIIMATPETGADFAEFITEGKTVAFDIVVGEFTKTEVEVEVLCFIPHLYENFGFNWFLIQEIIVREMCFFGDLCHKDPGYFVGTIYEQVFNLSAYPFDLPALFEVVVKKGEVEWTYQNFDLTKPAGERFIAPLCVKYPDLIRVPNEVFVFELWVYVPVGDDVDLVLFETWTLTEENINGEMLIDWSGIVNEFNVVEFVIGNCHYDPGENVLVYPPWQNLPDKTNAKITWKNYTIGGYWELVVNTVTPHGTKYDFPTSGTYLGWCGDPTQVIAGTTLDFFVYGSLNDHNWPVGMPVGLADLAAVNWLFNNLNLYFNIDPIQGNFIVPSDLPLDPTESKDLQHAIWLSLGFTAAQFPGPGQGGGTPSPKAIGMATDAIANNTFIPLPGGWAAVLLVKDEDGQPKVATNQLIFTVVDP